MHTHRKSTSAIEPLEARIAPAAVYPTIIDAERDPSGSHFKTTTVGTPILLKAGDVFSTGGTPGSGSYLMFVQKGQALVFTTDLNQNGSIDSNEVTGISAGDGLRLISFVDIHGDIVTNLRGNGILSDSDNDSSNDDLGLKGDGRLLLDSRIEKIELRSLSASDITDQNEDGVVDEIDVSLRLVMSSYSIFGQVLAGGGFGVKGDNTSGLVVDDRGKLLQQTYFTGPRPGAPFGPDYYNSGATPIKAMIGGIVVGSAASGEYFSFGIARNSLNDLDGDGLNGDLANGNDVQGTLAPFVAAAGKTGAGIFYVRPGDVPANADANSEILSSVTFNIGRLIAGDGGARAAGGNIENVLLNGDNAGGYVVLAGNGGSGSTGGAGGSVLGFADLSSNTSQLVVRGGTGGDGSTGAGGAGGVVTLGTFNVLGNIFILEGDGGSGFTSGGAGASLSRGTITAPERVEDFARNIVGTTHDTPHDPITGRRILLDPLAPGVIGQGNPVDFDGDGFGDIVFTSSDPSQLVVQFGNGSGGFRTRADGTPDRIYLDGPINAEALTIGDFDGDGHMDVAAGSKLGGSHAGIFVFLSKYEDRNGDGVLSASEDLDGDGFNDLVDFRAPRFSPLPHLEFLTRSGHSMNDLEAGDFNGDGFTDLAVVATYFSGVNGVQPSQQLIFMYPDIEDGKPTGQFLADYGTKAQAIPPIPAIPATPNVRIGAVGDDTANIEVTAVSRFSDHDVVVVLPDTGTPSRSLTIYDNYDQTSPIGAPSQPRLLRTIPLGQVDQNRDLPSGGSNNLQLTNAFGQDFAIIDFNNDGVADYTVLLETPAAFLISFQGDGSGGASRIDNIAALNGTQNAGFFLGPPSNNNGGADIGTAMQAIVGTDFDGDGVNDGVALLYTAGTGERLFTRVVEVKIGFPPATTQPQPGIFSPSVGTRGNPGGEVDDFFEYDEAGDPNIVAFDAYKPIISDPRINYAVGQQETGGFVELLGVNFIIGHGNLNRDLSGGNGQGGTTFVINAEHNLLMVAGSGGTGIIGRGGNGGNIGSGSINRGTGIGTLDIRVDFGRLQLLAGDGGNGFSGGGRGGSIMGTVFDGFANTALSNLINAQLFAGNGGLAVSGAGGAGGSLVGNSIIFGFLWVAGTGGSGITGGAGGSIVGNGINGLYDTQDLVQSLFAGAGGNGVRRGGDGGGIRNFHGSFDINSGVEGGLLRYIAGDGGSAVSGPGGNGGSILNVSPIVEDRNQLAGEIFMAGGRGGDGRSGGHGGSVDGFRNATDQFEVPGRISILGGAGGNGTKGAAGNGGSVRNISTDSTGAGGGLNRVVAGRGGDSAGSNGGNGGSVSGIAITAQDDPLVYVAGAGGDGLFRGGKGGSVTNSSMQIGNTSFAKGLVIAGEGGDANAYVANANDPIGLNAAVKAFGGKIGKGGDGGGISGITQIGSILARVDLIAGNGGDTVNFGTVVDISNFAGKGGSISNIVVDGTLGNVAANVPIRSYNNILAGETMDDFVQANLVNPFFTGSVADTVGNVGIVVGAAGRIKAVFDGYSDTNQADYPTLPAKKGINGSLSNIKARNIMAAVAGNVERIAAIQNIKNVTLTAGGDVGADKVSGILGDPSFLTAAGDPTPAPVLDGILIDGAMIVRSRPVNAAGKPYSLGPNVYILA